jgi:ABC-2 type transport system permease protein
MTAIHVKLPIPMDPTHWNLLLPSPSSSPASWPWSRDPDKPIVVKLHYRPWTGPLRPPIAAVWPIARTSLGLLFRRRMFWFLYVFALFLFLMFFFGNMMLDVVQSLFADAPIQIGKLKIEPAKALDVIRQRGILAGGRETFSYFFSFQKSIILIVVTLCGTVLVGDDFTAGSVPFYLAKPIRPRHYFLGKFLAVGVIVNLLTTLPALLLYAQHVLADWNYLLDPDYFRKFPLTGNPGNAGLPLLFGIVGYGLILTVFLGILLVATAAWAPRTMPLILVWSTLFLFLPALAKLLVERLRYDAHWWLLDPWYSIGLLGMACLGYQPTDYPDPQPSLWAAAAVLGGGCALCLIWLRRRLHRLEVVRSS